MLQGEHEKEPFISEFPSAQIPVVVDTKKDI